MDSASVCVALSQGNRSQTFRTWQQGGGIARGFGKHVGPATRMTALIPLARDASGPQCLPVLQVPTPNFSRGVSPASEDLKHKRVGSRLFSPVRQLNPQASRPADVLSARSVTSVPLSAHLPKMQTPSKYVTLVSADGFEFVVLRDAALVSPIIKGMLDVRSA